MSLARVIGLLVVALGVCGVGIAQEAPPPGGSPGAEQEPLAPSEVVGLGSLPASFEGEMPAPDGPQIRYHLDLFPGGVFVLRMTKPGREAPLDQIGNWAVSGDGDRLMLTSEGMIPRLYSIEDARTLHRLDATGRVIDPPSSYDLARIWPFAPVEPKLILRGLYGPAGDAGIFQECRTGWRLPVAPEGDGEALESAYSQAGRGAGEPLFVNLLGTIAHRPGPDDEGRMTLVVDRFIGVWPGENCGR